MDPSPVEHTIVSLTRTSTPKPVGGDSNVDSRSHEQKWIVIPVSVPGCGQAPVAKALESMFGFARAHTTKSSYTNSEGEIELPSEFVDKVVSSLKQNTVVIVDRANHRANERQAVRELFSRRKLNVNVLTIAWDLSKFTTAKTANICWNRLRAGICGEGPHGDLSFASVIRLIREYEAPGNGDADARIELRLDEDFSATLRRLVIAIGEVLGVRAPRPAVPPPSVIEQSEAVLQRPQYSTAPHSSRILSVMSKAERTRSRAAAPSRNALERLLKPHVLSSLHQSTVLVHSLMDVALRSRSRVTFRSWASPTGSVITSWKSQRHAVFENPCRLPTLARGLWTEDVTSPKTLRFSHLPDAHRIVARGYDKVFTMGETPWATWLSLEQYASPPFHVVAKITGCLIMLSALSPDSLAITTKYSFGSGSHVAAGERWLDMQLERLNKTRRQMAEYLWHQEWTLMCELCDESLEQYVFPIPYDQLGLNLHGINKCTTTFETEDPDLVKSVAKDWGFNPVYSVTAKSYKILEDIVTTSQMHGNRRYDFGTEGLVIRARINTTTDSSRGKYRGTAYPPPSQIRNTIFIKILFTKYLLRRALYDLTKNVVSMTGMRKPIAPVFALYEFQAYPSWMKRQLGTNPDNFRDHWGVIASLEEYTQWTKTDEGMIALAADLEADMILDLPPPRYKFSFRSSGKRLIILTGLPGCGKTTVSFALSRIFHWKHIEIRREKSRSTKKVRSVFKERVQDALRCRWVVIADGAFHRAKSREMLFEKDTSDAAIIALQWVTDATTSPDAVRICSDRLAEQASTEEVQVERDRSLRRWLAEYDPVGADEVDAVVPMTYNEDLGATILRAVSGLARLLCLQEPPPHVIADTINLLRSGTTDMTAIDVNESHHVTNGRRPGRVRLFT